MKTFVSKISAAVLVILLFVAVSTVTSCKKDKTTHGKVTVTNESHTPIAGAKVFLSAPSAAGQKTYTGTTESSGAASFDIPLPGIWDITVTKDALTGTGVLRLDEPGKKDEVTVIVR